MNDYAELGLGILQAASPLILALIAWLSTKAGALIAAKVKNETLAGLLARLNDSVWTVVRDVELTVVAKIKAAKDPTSPGGTDLTEEEGQEIQKAALDKLRDLWGVDGLTHLGSVLGLGEEGLTKFLTSKIEAHVHDLDGKASGKPAARLPQ